MQKNEFSKGLKQKRNMRKNELVRTQNFCYIISASSKGNDYVF